MTLSTLPCLLMSECESPGRINSSEGNNKLTGYFYKLGKQHIQEFLGKEVDRHRLYGMFKRIPRNVRVDLGPVGEYRYRMASLVYPLSV